MEKIETSEIAGFTYERAKFDSKTLNKAVTYGRLRLKSATGAPAATLYLLHGGNGDDRQAVDYGLPGLLSEKARAVIERMNLQIVLPFVGTSFLHAHPSEESRSFSDHFFTELMPAIDGRTTDETRFIAGFSMGGQAALNAFFRFPEKFAGVGANFPTLIAFDYSDAEEVGRFATRSGITPAMREILIGGFASEFVNRDDFQRHDPIHLAEALDPKRLAGKAIYFDVGSDDDFGLAEGARRFSEILGRSGVAHRHVEVPGGRHDGPFLVSRFGTMIDHLFA